MNIRKDHDYSALFAEIDQVIRAELSQMELYCELGKLICARPEKGAAVAAAAYLTEECPDQAGFSARNVRRMRDFYRMYENAPKLLAQAMHISWTQNVVILEADLTLEERTWYLQAAEKFGWSKLALQKKIAEAAHLTESLDTAPEICYTKQEREPRTISEAKHTLFAGEEKRIRASQESQNLLIAFSLYGNELPMGLRYCCFMELYKQQSILERIFVLLLQEKRQSPLPRGKPWTLLQDCAGDIGKDRSSSCKSQKFACYMPFNRL